MNKPKKALFLILTLLFACFTYNSSNLASAEGTNSITDEELKENDYIVYFVNAGDPTPETVEGTDKMGIYASKTEQMYGVDEVTGKKWGLVTTTSNESIRDESNKYGSLRYYSGTQTRDKALEYKFELPDGEYDITLGFKNPWSGRSVNVISEGENISNGDYSIGSYGEEKEITFRQSTVNDGELNVRIQGPSSDDLSNHNDPLFNYMIIKKYIVVPITDLETKLETAQAEAEKTDTYTKYSLEKLATAIDQGDALVKSVTEDGVDENTIQQEIRTAIKDLDAALEGLMKEIPNDSFKPGEVWRDTNGAVIQAHGGGIMYDEETEKYYWYGEDKTNGYLPARGVRVYSSTDLYNWKDEGLALTAIESMDQFETDPLISKLYEGRDDKEDIINDIGTNRVIERPKVIYNEKTDKYVMWMHTDGPTEWSDANYAKAEAGYAISDSPTGPFVYQESHRMDRAPEDAEFNGQPDQPGMARDMNLFKDDDGTAYLIYSSEENYTMYISKLNESYTDVVGWDQNGDGKRDATYQGEYGEDYIRLFPGAHREAPAMFKYDGKYYLITSGSSGWDPNRAQYTVAEDIFGEWKPMRDPSIGEGAATTFDSQSTNVIPVDPENGKFIFMGDRWNPSNLKDSRYVWLPIEFGQGDKIRLKWYDEWNLDVLDRMGRVTVHTELTKKVSVGETPDLPDVINVTDSDGNRKDTPVSWEINAKSFSKPGSVQVSGTLSELSNKVIRTEVIVIPDHVRYFVHAGGAETRDYKTWSSYMQDTLLNKEIIDQQYDPENGQTWGYVGDHTRPAGTEDENLFSSLRYLLSNSGDDLTYKFDLKDGKYTVYTGLYDRWYTSTMGSRKADIVINGETKTEGYVFTNSYDVIGYKNVKIADGKLDVTVHRVPGSPDPQISWIMIVEEDTTAPGITITGNEETYSIDSKIEISCDAVDDLSGIASKDCPDVSGNGYDYKVGVNEISATATDKAGNTEEVNIQFTVTVDFDSLSRLTNSFVTKEGVAHALTQKLQAAKEAAAKGNVEAQQGKLKAYVNHLSAQSEKSLSESEADLLISLSDHLK